MPVTSGLLPAKGVAAGVAAVVVEHFLVDDFAQGSASRAAHCAADQASNERAGDAAAGRSDRARDDADRGAKLRTGQGKRDAAGGARYRADGGGGLSCMVAHLHARGLAFRAGGCTQ